MKPFCESEKHRHSGFGEALLGAIYSGMEKREESEEVERDGNFLQ